MQGRLFEALGTQFPSYFVLLVTGFLFATIIGTAWARRIGQNPDVIVDLGLSMLIAGVFGARILHVFADGFFWDYVHLCTDPSLVEWKISRSECLATVEPGALGELMGGEASPLGQWDSAEKVCRPIERDCFAWARFWAGGLTYYGGFIGASLAAWYLLRVDKFPFWKAADMAGMVVPLGLAFGRMGCLLGGCCFGQPLEGPIGLSFPPYSPASSAQARDGLLSGAHEHSLSVHPTQLYEAWGGFALAAVLFFWLHGRKRYDGHVFAAFLGGYAVLRFVLEFFRADDRGGFFALSTSQWVGLFLVAAAVWLHKKRSSLGSTVGTE